MLAGKTKPPDTCAVCSLPICEGEVPIFVEDTGHQCEPLSLVGKAIQPNTHLCLLSIISD